MPDFGLRLEDLGFFTRSMTWVGGSGDLTFVFSLLLDFDLDLGLGCGVEEVLEAVADGIRGVLNAILRSSGCLELSRL